MKKLIIRLTAGFVLMTFTSTQMGWAEPPFVADSRIVRPEKTMEVKHPELPPIDIFSPPENSVDFLMNASPLSPAESQEDQGREEDAIAPEDAGQKQNEGYEYERYDFEEALELLRPEFAAAVIVKSLTKENIESLLQLTVEAGIAVLHGEIVLFTSGSSDRLGVLPAVQALTDQAAFISHTHPGMDSSEGPSGQDFNQAVSDPGREYVLTRLGAYAYNKQGLLHGGDPYGYDEYLAELSAAVRVGKIENDPAAVRRDLNAFITGQDRYNQASEAERIVLRGGGTQSNTPGLFSSSVTTLAGSPYPYMTAGSSAATTLSSNTSQILLGYSVPGASDISGLTISFDNASTPAIETQSISALTYLTFGLKGPNASVKLEIVDINNNADTFTLTNVSNLLEQFWRISVSSIANTLDKTKIKAINFIVGQSNTTAAARTGTLYVRAGGLKTTAPSQPVITSTVPTPTNQTALVLSGTKEANTSIWINNVQAVDVGSATTWTATVNLTTEGSNALSVTSKSAIGKVSTAKSLTVVRDTIAPAGTLNINSGAAYASAQNVTLALSATDSGSGRDKMSFSIDNVNWTAAEAFASTKTFALPAGDGSKTVYVKYFDKAGNASAVYSKSIILDTLPPTGTAAVGGGALFIRETAVTLTLAAVDEGSGLDKMSFSSNGTTWTTAETYAAAKAWTFSAGDGNKTVYVKFLDKSGKWSAPVSTTVLLDTTAPAGTLKINNDAASTTSPDITLAITAIDAGSGIAQMRFSSDGGATWTDWENAASSKNLELSESLGEKEVRAELRDAAGNAAVFSDTILLETPPGDGTQFFYDGTTLVREVTPDGHTVFYRTDGSVDRFRYADGSEIRYLADASGSITRYDAAGALIETITNTALPELDESGLLKMTLENGLEVFYRDGVSVEFKTAAGIRVTDFTLDEENNIQNAVIRYPDGTLEIIRSGALVRRIRTDGSIFDITPKGFAVREIFSTHVDYYDIKKTSQTEITRTRVFTAAGANTLYDELGILRETRDAASGLHFIYTRAGDGGGYVTALDRAASSAPGEKTPVEFRYAAGGVLTRVTLQDGTVLTYEAGVLTRAVDQTGQVITYTEAEVQNIAGGIRVNREGTEFLYDATGFLKSITTAEGTIQRVASDTDQDGSLSDEQIIDLILDEAGGNRLSDFELDSDGHILNGIIQTKEGIKQRIENGILTGFETVDGKLYTMRGSADGGREAVLTEWKTSSGSRVLYDAYGISEVIFTDGKRLHTLGWSSAHQLKTYTEESPDGARKTFSDSGDGVLRLVKMITSDGAEIDYDSTGLAEKVILSDQSEVTVSYQRDSSGNIEAIEFRDAQGAKNARVFSPDGTLKQCLINGVSAAVEQGEISELFTRFGAVTTPAFDTNGLMTGDVRFSDGTTMKIEHGELKEAIRSDGTRVLYNAGRVDEIDIPKSAGITKRYRLIYQTGSDGKIQDIRVRLESEAGTPEFPLVPFLENPDQLLRSAGSEIENQPVTFHGDAQIVTEAGSAKFGTGAAAFDGSGDFLSVEHSSNFEFGTGNWTIDFWVKFNEKTREYALYRKGDHANGGVAINCWSAYDRWDIFVADNNVLTAYAPITVDRWMHVALVRDGGYLKFYQDGALAGSVAVRGSGNVTNQEELRIGANPANIQYFPGMMDDLRVTKGRARWTTEFTPPTESVTADGDTKLLLDFEPPREDATPVTSDAEKLAAILLPRSLHNSLADRSNIRSIYALSENSTGTHAFTLSGDAAMDSADKKFGDGSLKLDGTGDALEMAHDAAFEFGTADWTIDFWVKFDEKTREYALYRKGDHTNGGIAINCWSAYNSWDIFVADNNVLSVTSPVEINRWYHIALVRDGSYLKFFKDGVMIGCVAVRGSGNVTNQEALRIGANPANIQYFPGRIDELRVTKGAALWKTAFDPPVAEPARDEHTALLLHFSQQEFQNHREILPLPEEPAGDAPDNTLFLAELTLDPERGETYEFAKNYFPEWLNLSRDQAIGTSGFIAQGIHKGSDDAAADLVSTTIDMDGDGLLDRVWSSSGSEAWWFQKNNGLGFDEAVRWTGVNTTFNSYTIRETAGPSPIFYTQLADVNGDKKPDRVLTAYNDPLWRVQLNNGLGFDPIRDWSNAQVLSFYTPEGKYAVESRFNKYGGDIQDLQSALVDLDGDGLVDRVVRPYPAEGAAPPDHWFFQKNLSTCGADGDAGKTALGSNGSECQMGFADAALWKGVDWSFYPAYAGSYAQDPRTIGASLDWQYIPQNGPWDLQTTMGDLIDMTGDGRPDRVLLKHKNPSDVNSAFDWYVQINNGLGFDAAVLWDSDVREVPGFTASSGSNNHAIGTAISVFGDLNNSRGYSVNLIDVTGDGRPDRVTMPAHSLTGKQSSWWVEVNTGATFSAAVEWTGIEGDTAAETAIGQDTDLYHTNRNTPTNCDRVSPCSFQSTIDLKDMNGDKIPDRIIFREGEAKWLVQFGTGSGFLPIQEMKIAGLATETQDIASSRYDYLHVSLKAASDLPAALGNVLVILNTPAEEGAAPENSAYQEWTIENLTADWQDFYLPIDKTKANASEVKVKFIPAAGSDPNIALYVDNVTFTALRPSAVKDWLERMLTDEAALEGIDAERSETLASYLGFTEAAEAETLEWQKFLAAETRLDFDAAGEVRDFQTAYGTVSEVEDGKIVESVLADGTHITFSAGDSEHPNQTTQQIVNESGAAQSMALSYGRVRTVTREGKSPLEYSYAFDETGAEITVVYDPDSGVTERYAKLAGADRLISRTQANGVVTEFIYSGNELSESRIVYKGRVRNTFYHGTTAEGHRTITTDEGIQETYDLSGSLLFHTTPEGFRYQHTKTTAENISVADEIRTQTFTDGTTLTVHVPTVTRTACSVDCEAVEQIDLVSYTSKLGEIAEYSETVSGADGKVDLSGLLLADGSRINFSRIERVETFNAGTGKTDVTIRLMDAAVFHADGTVTEFRDGKPYSVTSATGHVISLGVDGGFTIDADESAAFHLAAAGKLWTGTVESKWRDFRLPDTFPVRTELALDAAGASAGAAGRVVSRQYSEGTIELYNLGGQVEQILSPSGERLVSYTYDSEGNPVAVSYEASRRNLAAAELKLKAEVAMEREAALRRVADRAQVLNETIEGEYLVARDYLLSIRAKIEGARNQVAGISVKGKQAKQAIGNIMSEIQVNLDQVNQALAQLAGQRAGALADLAVQVAEANTSVETQTADAYTQIAAEAAHARELILKQEISPVIYHWYRKILGRDPNKTEYDQWIEEAGTGSSGAILEEGGSGVPVPVWLHALKQSLLASSELTARTNEVGAIKARVHSELTNYLAMTDEEKLAFAASLGIDVSAEALAASPNLLAAISESDVTAILAWLDSRSLHFGQSAFIALEALLAASPSHPVAVSRVDLATQLIMMDILTGTITPLENDDLLISMYAMNRAAEHYGLSAKSYAMNYAALQSMFEQVCGLGSLVCGLRLVAHINGNHYVIITHVTDTEVTYIDPGLGPESALDSVTVSKDDFIAVWGAGRETGETGIGKDWGYILLPQPANFDSTLAPHPVSLSPQQQMSIRGAFFPLLIVVAVIIKAIVAAVAGVISAIAAVVGGIISGIGTIIQGFGTFVGMLGAGHFSAAFGGLFNSVLAGLGQIGMALVDGVMAFGTTFKEVFLAGGLGGSFGNGFTFMGVIKGVAGSFKALGGKYLAMIGAKTAMGAFIKTTLFGLTLEGVATLGEAIGVSPKIINPVMAGGKMILGIGLIATGNPMGVVAGLGMVGSSTGDFLNLYTDLPPVVTNVISIGAMAAGAFVGAGFNTGTLAGAISGFSSAIPFLGRELATAGLAAAGDVLGLDPRITALISIPVRAGVGVGLDSLLYAKTVNPTSVFAAIKNGLAAGAKSIGLEFGGASANSIFGSLTSGNILGSIGSALGNSDLFSNIFDVVGQALLSPVNLVGGVLKTAVDGVTNFASLIQEKGLGGAFESLATSIFSRKTLESLLGSGGVGGILDSAAKVLTTINGQNVQEQKLSGSTSLFYDLSGQFIGKKENGVTQIGTFGFNSLGKWGLLAGQFIAAIAGDYVFAGTVQNGQLMQMSLEDNNGNVVLQGDPEKSGQAIAINGSGSGSGFWNIVLKVLPYAMDFVIGSGLLQKVDAAISSTNASISQSQKELYVLTNGIMNPKTEGSPSGFVNLSCDIKEQSHGQITDKDILLTPLYNSISGSRLTMPIDLVKDILSVVAESQSATGHLWIVTSILEKLQELSTETRNRPMVGVGHSGGFVPLVEALYTSGVKTEGLVAMGAAYANITGLPKETLDLIINIASLLERGIVDGVGNLFETLVKKIPGLGDILGPIAGLMNSFLSFLNQNTIQKAFEILKQVTTVVLQGLELVLPNMKTCGATYMVNLYGSVDLLNQLGISGYRDNLAGFAAGDVDNPLYNIEIIGAGHRDYTRKTNGSAWNQTVSDFVAKLIVASNSQDRLAEFLARQIQDGIVVLDGHRYIVNLPGRP